ncbi:MAG: PopZ family protein [Bosea sp. (in: a-proteobacteria)]
MSTLAKGNEPSMEEILASIRRIIADDQQAVLSEKDAPAAQPPAPQFVAEPEDEVLDLAVVAKSLPPEPVSEPQGQEDVDLLFAEVEPEPEPAIIVPPPPPVIAAPIPPVQAATPELQPSSDLMSAATSASIAGAFSSLSSTLITGNARTLEDLVKDMMKPMLKTWLDDNLPTIVERLVKTEIERVSRGGR